MATATLPLCAVMSGPMRAASVLPCAKTALGANVKRMIATAMRRNIMHLLLSRIFMTKLVEKALAVRGDAPGVGPEAEIDAPPVIGYATGQELRNELIEVEDALPERDVFARVAGERAVGIADLHVHGFALQLLQKLEGAAR